MTDEGASSKTPDREPSNRQRSNREPPDRKPSDGPGSPSTSDGFDRLRRRRPGTDDVKPGTDDVRRPDPQGRSALYSVSVQPAAPGAVTVDCSSCGRVSTVTPLQLVLNALPSVHLPLLRRGHPSFMRCAACRRRTWVKIGLTL